MRIIKAGDLEKLKGIRRFECGQCGCIFEAEKTEYKYQFSQREGCGWYETHCPTCRSLVSADER